MRVLNAEAYVNPCADLWVDIYIKPKRPIEFIYVPIRIVSTEEFNEGDDEADA